LSHHSSQVSQSSGRARRTYVSSPSTAIHSPVLTFLISRRDRYLAVKLMENMTLKVSVSG